MIAFMDVYKRFGSNVVLRGLSFTVERGEIYGLLGSNGAGKTTAINILCSLLDADSGNVEINGRAVSGSTKYCIGTVPQEISVYRDLTCLENLGFFATIYGVHGSHRRNRIKELVDIFDLHNYTNTEVSKLSGGWRKRINIAVGLIHEPLVLVLDEPTAGLDVDARNELWELIHKLCDSGTSILLTTHHLDEVEQLCSRIGIIHNGRIVCEGSLDKLRSIVPAKQLAIVLTDEAASVARRASSFGWQSRRYGGRSTLLLPRHFTLKEIIDRFEGIPITSITLKEIGLEEVYIENTRNDPRVFSHLK